MFGVLRGIAVPAIRYLGPILASWGLNKLFQSNGFRSQFPEQLKQAAKLAVTKTVETIGQKLKKRLKDPQEDWLSQDQQQHNSHKYMPMMHRKKGRKRVKS